MTLLQHHMTWKASERNKPDFPQVHYYNDLLIDYVNELYESIYSYPKYVNWELSTKYMLETLPYGIVPIDEEGPELLHVEPVKGLTRSLHCIILRQRSDVPYTGIKAKEETKLLVRLIARLLQGNCSTTAMSIL